MFLRARGIGHVEAPRGECFHYVLSDGTNRPARHKVRAPTFMNLPTYKATIVGETISDAAIILAAISSPSINFFLDKKTQQGKIGLC